MSTKKSARAKRQAIVVLGMHRSGTSALAGILNILGCEAPKTLMPQSEANEKGFFEATPIYAFHKDLLDSAGSSWMDWQPFHEGWFMSVRAEEYKLRATEVLGAEFGTSRLFVLKDPRMCRLVPFWVETLADMDIQPLIFHTHRNPVDVASSLARHHNISHQLGMMLWLRHVLDAERDTRNLPRCFTSYARLLNGWANEIKRGEAVLGIIFPRQSSRVQTEIGCFLEGALQHFKTTADQLANVPNVSNWVRATFGILERWAESGEDPADHAELDQISREFDQAGPAFATLVSNGEYVRKKLESHKATIEFLSASQKDLQNHLVLAEKQSMEIADLETGLDAQKRLVVDLESKNKEDREKLRHAEGLRDSVQGQLIAVKEHLETEKTTGRKTLLDLEASEAEIEVMREEQALLQSKLRQREEELSQAAREHDQTAQVVEQLESAHTERLETFAQKLTQKDIILNERAHRVADLEKGVAVRVEEIATLTRVILETELDAAAVRQHCTDLELTAERLEFDNMALRSSTSWRLTAPLRKLSAFFRRR